MTQRTCYYGDALPAGIYERDGLRFTLWTDSGPVDARPILFPDFAGNRSIGGRAASQARWRIRVALDVDRRKSGL
jgi:hypothetical protein